MKVLATGLVLCVAAAAIGGGCKERAEGKTEGADQPAPVRLAAARAGPVQRYVDVVGTLFGDEEATVSAKVPGRIVQVARDVGDRVAPGRRWRKSTRPTTTWRRRRRKWRSRRRWPSSG